MDLEATCWEYKNPLMKEEIIEIGAYKVDENGVIESEFDRLVKPSKSVGVSSYCTRVTGIRNSDLVGADAWPHVYAEFIDWIDDIAENYILMAWGQKDYDWIIADCKYHGIETPEFNYLDMKETYRRIRNLKKATGFMKVLDREGIEFEGDEHNALDDSYGLTKLYLKYQHEWYNYFYLT